MEDDPHFDNDLITRFHEQKIAHYERLAEANPDKYGKFLAGWKRRANNVLSDLGHYFENDEPTPKAHDEDDVMLQEPITQGVLTVSSNVSYSFEDMPTETLMEHLKVLMNELKKRTGI